MKISLFAFILIIFIVHEYPNVSNRDRSIGYIKENDYYLRDSTELKSKFLKVVSINNPDVSELNKIEIIKTRTLGDKQITEYLLIGYNHKKQLKIARCLRLKNDLFFLEEDLKKPSRRDDFYSSYFICFNSNQDCFPNIALFENEKRWVSNNLLGCFENDCKCLTVLVDYD